MNTDDINTAFWKANIDARFSLAGLPGNFDSKKGAFLATALTSISFPGRIIPTTVDPNTLPDSTTTSIPNSFDARFNRSVLNIADFMPAADTPYYTPTANRRAFNLYTYLGYVDPGAPRDPAAMRLYLTDKPAVDNQQTKVNGLLEAALTAYAALSPAATVPFNVWIRTQYPKRFTLQTEMSNLSAMKASLQTEAQTAFGPVGLALEAAKTNVGKAVSASIGDINGDFTMLCDQTFATYYQMGSVEFCMAYDTWQRTSSGIDSPPKLVQEIDHGKSNSLQMGKYGLDEKKVEAGLELCDPFFFFGEGSYSTREEKLSMYKSNNFSSIKVSVTCLGSPRLFTITPGTWGSTDAKTAFPKLVNGAPTNVDDLLYPFVTQVVVGYGVGYKIELDKKTYSEFKSFHSKDRQGQVFGIFDIFFEGGLNSNSTDKRTFQDINLSDEHNTITVLPNKDMLATTLGVIIARDSSDAKNPVSVDVEHILTGDLSGLAQLPGDIETDSIGNCLSSFAEGLSNKQRSIFRHRLRNLLTGPEPAQAASQLQDLIVGLTSGSILTEEEDTSSAQEKLSFKQTVGSSEITIIVESGSRPTKMDVTEKPVEFQVSPAATRALGLASSQLQDINNNLGSNDIAKYIQASYNLDKLFEPVIYNLAQLASVSISQTRRRALVRPLAGALVKLADDHAPMRPLVRRLIISGPVTGHMYDPGMEFAAWATTTRAFPQLGGNKHYALVFSRPNNTRLPFTLVNTLISIQLATGEVYYPTLTGDGNAYYWFEADAMTNVQLQISADAYIPAVIDRALWFSLFEL